MLALQEFLDLLQAGYPQAIDANDLSRVNETPVIPQQIWVDAGYMTETVYQFCRANQEFCPAVGRGATQELRAQRESQPGGKSVTRKVGEGYQLNWLRTRRILLAEVNADHWTVFLLGFEKPMCGCTPAWKPPSINRAPCGCSRAHRTNT